MLLNKETETASVERGLLVKVAILLYNFSKIKGKVSWVRCRGELVSERQNFLSQFAC